MITALTIVHTIVSILLIFMVLIHFGKGAEAGLVLDVGASSILPQKGNVLNKITTVLAILFLSLSLALSAMRGKNVEKSIFDNKNVKTKTAMPSNPMLPLQLPETKKESAPVSAPAAAPAAAPANAPAPDKTSGKK
ncbi:MAG: preprotein translocase subunit SecG [Oligoflexia bacterium]|nr:preprotein translocase subunit SecG [Oligoflexia bacterium]